MASGIRLAADHLRHPPAYAPDPCWGESLASGVPGILLLHIERAHTGRGTWDTAHRWAAAATRTPVTANLGCGLFQGAPAVAYALAAADHPAYTRALRTLDRHVLSITARRLAAAHARIDRGELPELAEYDLINGLTGLGCYLLHHHRDNPVIRDVLSYLVRLTEPLTVDADPVPGWWTGHGPGDRPSARFPTGHANLGLAHGITGPLALLATALRAGIAVERHAEAIETICGWLNQWRQDQDLRTWWPPWITLDEHRTGRTGQAGPFRPSWCYGTPGQARTLQLAGLATGDPVRQRDAERALLGCISDPQQLASLTDTTLCHGWAGLVHTAWAAAADAQTGELAAQLPRLRRQLIDRYRDRPDHAGLLEGHTGVALALHTTAADTPPASGWDTCLLTTR
jgi:class I lanthipeptide synthase